MVCYRLHGVTGCAVKTLCALQGSEGFARFNVCSVCWVLSRSGTGVRLGRTASGWVSRRGFGLALELLADCYRFAVGVMCIFFFVLSGGCSKL